MTSEDGSPQLGRVIVEITGSHGAFRCHQQDRQTKLNERIGLLPTVGNKPCTEKPGKSATTSREQFRKHSRSSCRPSSISVRTRPPYPSPGIHIQLADRYRFRLEREVGCSVGQSDTNRAGFRINRRWKSECGEQP